MSEKAAPRRVLIVGEAEPDTVGDSYLRTLTPHYEVRVFDPFESIVSSLPKGSRMRELATSAVYHASNIFLREPIALALPRLARVAASFAPDVVLVTAITTLPPRAVSKLRGGNRDARVIGVFSDHIGNFGRGYFFTADYDALFFKDRYVVTKLRDKLGWNHAFYLPQACDPSLHHPVTLTDEERRFYGCDLTLAGNSHPFRAAQLACLGERDLKIWGSAPPMWLDHPILKRHTERHVIGLEKCKAMTASKIVLNANHYAEIAGTNKRTFEVAAIGAFQLTDTPALSDVFDPETEVAAFSTQREMLDQIDHYLARPELRAAMAKKACERAHREHTYAHRWAAHLEALGLDVPSDFPVQIADLAVHAA